jgi:hypothetical protein
VSLDQGRTWHKPVRVSAHTGRVDYPRVAVGGGRMFAVWTQANSGSIRMATSDDRGHHWSTATIGSTTWRSSSGEGFRGLPDIGVSGDDVAAAWFSTGGGAQEAVTSNTGGDDLATATPVALTGPSPNDGQHYPAVAGAVAPGDPRVALAYSTNTGLDLRIFDGSTLSRRAPSSRGRRSSVAPATSTATAPRCCRSERRRSRSRSRAAGGTLRRAALPAARARRPDRCPLPAQRR